MVSVVSKLRGKDKSIKYIFKDYKDHIFEAIIFSLAREPGKSIICLSTQSGCNMHCGFCETGKMGYCYNLSSQDIFAALEIILSENRCSNVKWVSLMGMGEPLYNYDNIEDFYYLVKDKYDLTLSLSTCGVSPRIMELADSPLHYHLFVSLHFSNNRIRSMHMPINRTYDIESVFEACDYYHFMRPKEKIEISYIMLDGINTAPDDIDALIRLTNKEYYLVQLLFYNECKTGQKKYKRIDMDKAVRIDQYLKTHGVNSYLSVSAGQDIGGACGQMATCIEDIIKV